MSFCHFTLEHEAFISGKFDTNFVKHHFKPEYLDQRKEDEELVAALLTTKLVSELSNAKANASEKAVQTSKWRANRS